MAEPVADGAGRRHVVRTALAALAALALAVLASVAAAGPAAAESDATVSTTIDGRPVSTSSESHPIRLRPAARTNVRVEIRNNTPRSIDVRSVRIEGRVIGLAFFAYDTSVGIRVPPGATEQVSFILDLSGLNGQATGLIPGYVKVLDADHDVLGAQRMVVDVRGSLRSVYGLFAIVIAVMTGVALTRAILDVARHRGSRNRWWRAVRFAIPGIGIGLVATFTLSATRVFAPRPGRWVPIVLICGIVGFVLGYLTPTPDDGEDTDAEASDVIDLQEPAADSADSADGGRATAPSTSARTQ